MGQLFSLGMVEEGTKEEGPTVARPTKEDTKTDQEEAEEEEEGEEVSGSEEETTGEDLGTPPQHKLLQKKMKSLVLDPRSPSGIPRTPILVESGGTPSASPAASGPRDDTPAKRGQIGAKPVMLLTKSKLAFSPQEQEMEKENLGGGGGGGDEQDALYQHEAKEDEEEERTDPMSFGRSPLGSTDANVIVPTAVNQTVII